MRRTCCLAGGLALAYLSAPHSCEAGGYYYEATSYHVAPPVFQYGSLFGPPPVLIYARPFPPPTPPPGVFQNLSKRGIPPRPVEERVSPANPRPQLNRVQPMNVTLPDGGAPRPGPTPQASFLQRHSSRLAIPGPHSGE